MNLTTKYSFMKKLETIGHEVPLPLRSYHKRRYRKVTASLYFGYEFYKGIATPWHKV